MYVDIKPTPATSLAAFYLEIEHELFPGDDVEKRRRQMLEVGLWGRREQMIRRIERELARGSVRCATCADLAATHDRAVVTATFASPAANQDLSTQWEIGDVCRAGRGLEHLELVHRRNFFARLPLCALYRRNLVKILGPHRPLIALIACSATKGKEAAPARDLYKGELFKKARTWAERNADAWAILSAEHGLVMPDQVIEPYNTKMPANRDSLHWWAHNVGYNMAVKWCGAHVVLLAGLAYRAPLLTGTYAGYFTWESPLEGLEIGEQLRALKEGIEVRSPDQVTAAELRALREGRCKGFG